MEGQLQSHQELFSALRENTSTKDYEEKKKEKRSRVQSGYIVFS